LIYGPSGPAAISATRARVTYFIRLFGRLPTTVLDIALDCDTDLAAIEIAFALHTPYGHALLEQGRFLGRFEPSRDPGDPDEAPSGPDPSS
jgi:hypothetical protein